MSRLFWVLFFALGAGGTLAFASCVDGLRDLVLARGLTEHVVQFEKLHSIVQEGKIEDPAVDSLLATQQSKVLKDLQGALGPSIVSLGELLKVAELLRAREVLLPTEPPKEEPIEEIRPIVSSSLTSPIELELRNLGNHSQAIAHKITVKDNYEIQKIAQHSWSDPALKVHGITWGPNGLITAYLYKTTSNSSGQVKAESFLQLLKFDKASKSLVEIKKFPMSGSNHSPLWMSNEDLVEASAVGELGHWQFDPNTLELSKKTIPLNVGRTLPNTLLLSPQGTLAVAYDRSIKFFSIQGRKLKPVGNGEFEFLDRSEMPVYPSWDDRGNLFVVRKDKTLSSIGREEDGSWQEKDRLDLGFGGGLVGRPRIGLNGYLALTVKKDQNRLLLIDISNPAKLKVADKIQIEDKIENLSWLDSKTLLMNGVGIEAVAEVHPAGLSKPTTLRKDSHVTGQQNPVLGPDGFSLVGRLELRPGATIAEWKDWRVSLERWDPGTNRFLHVQTFSEELPQWGDEGHFLVKNVQEGKKEIVIYQVR